MASPDGSIFRKDRLSASALGMFVRCPEQYRRSYLQDEWGAAGPGAVVGNVVHGVLERVWRHRIDQGVLPSEARVAQLLDDVHEQQIEKARADDVAFDEVITPGGVRTRAGYVLAPYLARVAPLVEPEATEEEFALDVPGVPVPIVGRVDLRGRLPLAPGVLGRATMDVKTSGRSAKSVKPDWRVQGLVYLLASGLPMVWHTITWSGKAGPGIWTPADEDASLVLPLTGEAYAAGTTLIRRLVAGISAYHAAFGPDEPWPSGAVAHQWACDYCPHRPSCVYWLGEPGFLDLVSLVPEASFDA